MATKRICTKCCKEVEKDALDERGMCVVCRIAACAHHWHLVHRNLATKAKTWECLLCGEGHTLADHVVLNGYHGPAKPEEPDPTAELLETVEQLEQEVEAEREISKFLRELLRTRARKWIEVHIASTGRKNLIDQATIKRISGAAEGDEGSTLIYTEGAEDSYPLTVSDSFEDIAAQLVDPDWLATVFDGTVAVAPGAKEA